MSDEEPAQQSGDDASPPAATTEKKTWDADADIFCRDVRAFYKNNPSDCEIKQNSSVLRDGTPVSIGKAMLSLRTKLRQEKCTPLIKLRLDALKDVEGFNTFLKQTGSAKPKTSPEMVQASKRLKSKIFGLRSIELRLNILLHRNQLTMAKQEFALFSRPAKRRRVR